MRAGAGRRRAERGFTVLELMFVSALVAVLAGMAMLVTPSVLAKAKADSAASSLTAVLRMAREQAIAQRRNVLVEFLDTDRVRVSRFDVPGPGTSLLSEARLEQRSQYVRFAGVPDTPDLFATGAAAVDFGLADAFIFTSEGSFVDQNGDELNGAVFIGLPNQPETAQAVTIFGPTAYVRPWRWNGAQWVE